ncbi:MAG: DUF2225 domain-containing protein [Myxococcota bacterium]
MLWLWLSLSSASLATRVKYQDIPCPLGEGDVVRIYERVSSNASGGFDSDLASYSSDGQFREYAVATCANSLFSLMAEDMSEPLPSGVTRKLNRALEAARAALSDPTSPRVWQRYEIAAQMYAALDAPPLQIAEVYLQASWVARDTVVGFHRGLEGPAAVKQLFEMGAAELDKPLSPADRRTVLYSLARAAHRGGYSARRDQYLAQFEAVGPLTDGELRAVAEFRHIVTEVEPYYQDQALVWLKEALSDDSLEEVERIQATYLIADLSRRRGLAGAAAPLYREVATHPKAPDSLRSMAELLLEDTQVQE